MFGYALEPLALDTGDRNTVVMSETGTGSYFTTLGVRAEIGRTFSASDEDGPDAAPVAVLSHAAWRRRFAATRRSSGALSGSTAPSSRSSASPPAEFTGLSRVIVPDLWIPMRWTSGKRQLEFDDAPAAG